MQSEYYHISLALESIAETTEELSLDIFQL